jgi:hypothetical protein
LELVYGKMSADLQTQLADLKLELAKGRLGETISLPNPVDRLRPN